MWNTRAVWVTRETITSKHMAARWNTCVVRDPFHQHATNVSSVHITLCIDSRLNPQIQQTAWWNWRDPKPRAVERIWQFWRQKCWQSKYVAHMCLTTGDWRSSSESLSDTPGFPLLSGYATPTIWWILGLPVALALLLVQWPVPLLPATTRRQAAPPLLADSNREKIWRTFRPCLKLCSPPTIRSLAFRGGMKICHRVLPQQLFDRGKMSLLTHLAQTVPSLTERWLTVEGRIVWGLTVVDFKRSPCRCCCEGSHGSSCKPGNELLQWRYLWSGTSSKTMAQRAVLRTHPI